MSSELKESKRIEEDDLKVETCPICRDEYTKGNPAERMVPESETCKHTAHRSCFGRWAKSAKTDSCIFCNNSQDARNFPPHWMPWVFE